MIRPDYRHGHFIVDDEVLPDMIRDMTCSADRAGYHEISLIADYYYCTACGWPAVFDVGSDQWFTVRPFVIVEMPGVDL